MREGRFRRASRDNPPVLVKTMLHGSRYHWTEDDRVAIRMKIASNWTDLQIQQYYRVHPEYEVYLFFLNVTLIGFNETYAAINHCVKRRF